MSTNVPATIYRNTDGLTEYTSEEHNYIVDSLGDFLVDPLGDYIVDTGVVATLIPDTIWIENDGV